ncbi:Dfm1 protein [Martiniozyma asiatica (nom. inval.)]|nr:Dfm1 protein [Martiniozyma asiatica]
MSDLSQFVSSIPPVTRCITLTSLIMAGLNALQIVPISSFCPIWELVWRRWEIYRLLTGFLIPNPQAMQGMMEIYMLYSFSRGVEEAKFRKNLPDYLFYYIIVLPIILTGSLVILPPMYSLNSALLSCLTFTWSISNYSQEVNFYFMPIKASLLPAVSLGFRLLVDGGSSFVLALIGSFAAYVYNCIETNSLGPLVQFITGDEPQASTRLGTINSASHLWYYSTGHIAAPAWLRNAVSNIMGVDYGSVAYNRGFTVYPAKPVYNTTEKTGTSGTTGSNWRATNVFKGEGRRLGSAEK